MEGARSGPKRASAEPYTLRPPLSLLKSLSVVGCGKVGPWLTSSRLWASVLSKYAPLLLISAPFLLRFLQWGALSCTNSMTSFPTTASLHRAGTHGPLSPKASFLECCSLYSPSPFFKPSGFQSLQIFPCFQSMHKYLELQVTFLD